MDKIDVYDGKQLWRVLPNFFLKKIDFVVDGKSYRSGVFHNYKTTANQYRIKFKGDTRIMVLPIPFEVLVQNDLVVLDYRAATLFHGDEKLINTLKKVKKEDASAFFDKLVKIKVIE